MPKRGHRKITSYFHAVSNRSDSGNVASRCGARPSLFCRDRIKSIHRNNKLLVFGFIREHDKVTNQNTPQLANYLCLLFMVETDDQWSTDSKCKHHSIKINGKTAKRMTEYGYKSAYLSNRVSSGIHIWTFKYVNIGYYDKIGIHSTTDKLTVGFDLDSGHDAYAFAFGGGSLKEREILRYGSGGGIAGYYNRNGDIIEMTLNFNQLSLSYRVNEVYCFRKSIKKGTYVAGMTFSDKDVEVELMSYQRVEGRLFNSKIGWNEQSHFEA